MLVVVGSTHAWPPEHRRSDAWPPQPAHEFFLSARSRHRRYIMTWKGGRNGHQFPDAPEDPNMDSRNSRARGKTRHNATTYLSAYTKRLWRKKTVSGKGEVRGPCRGPLTSDRVIAGDGVLYTLHKSGQWVQPSPQRDRGFAGDPVFFLLVLHCNIVLPRI